MSNLLIQLQARRAITRAKYQRSNPIVKYGIEPFTISSFECTTNVAVQYMRGLRKLRNYYYGMSIHLGANNGISYVEREGAGIGFWKSFSELSLRHPLAVAVAITGLKGGAADYVAQKYIEKKRNLDTRRFFVFVSFGAFYSGCICHTIYTKLFPQLWPAKTLPNILRMIAFDCFVNTPFILFPILYGIKELLIFRGSLQCALRKYKEEAFEATVESWKIWMPCHLVTFGIVPMHARVPFVSVISFFFFTLVSYQQSKFDKKRLHLKH